MNRQDKGMHSRGHARLEGDEWNGVWGPSTEIRKHHPTPEIITKCTASNASLRTSYGHIASVSFSKINPYGASDSPLRTILRKELGHTQRKVVVGEQSVKRRRNNDGSVDDLIMRMSSTSLIRSGPSGRLLDQSARRKILGETNASFSVVNPPSKAAALEAVTSFLRTCS